MTCGASITFDEAVAVLQREAQPLGVETTQLSTAGRRVLAEAVHARIDAPRYSAAAMDGFAVSAAESAGGACRVLGASYPGEPWLGRLKAGEAVRIMTGAAAPAGACRIIPLELVEENSGILSLPQVWPAKSHIRHKGCDIKIGQIMLAAGTLLDPRALLVAAAADVATVQTWRRPIVSVLASGDELVSPGKATELDYTIPDSLSEAILLLSRQYGAKPGSAALVADTRNAILAAAETMMSDCDVLVLIGGASRGDRDFAKAGLRPLGLDVRFSDVAMKPGKPVWYGRIGAKHIIGLPGNPTAALTTARLILAPLLRALEGRDLRSALNWQAMPLKNCPELIATRESFLCGTIEDGSVEILKSQSASSQLMLARANVLVRVPANQPTCAAGSVINALKF
ncbi:molybdopterin molybdotransferase [Sphingomonas vulcanisoli]|uniref:Molybdopterin molybdenumtransferase n=1 Tax=Sphingomonas vulcanisoli TaxID=1658060 RepID=A0ABX0TW84_9SPHN|nr:molybdopterin molybdotransferase MoeA [Sphingomonas vulcanisoli]NIJ09303.1 molybdopterin molybdotransferase [Sphingomonas vulcanisoli]